jgi:integrase
MKMRQPHLVPLSRQALALIEELRGITGKGRFLFPNLREPGACMDQATLSRALLRTLGYRNRLTAHGFRATASTALNERGYRGEVIERQLAHAPRDKIRATYNQAEYLPERRTMLQDWADMIDAAGTSNVVPIKAATVAA